MNSLPIAAVFSFAPLTANAMRAVGDMVGTNPAHACAGSRAQQCTRLARKGGRHPVCALAADAAEQNVGLPVLKGLDVVQIAEIRGAASGSVRAQLTGVHAQAGISGRAQFAAWLVENLLAPDSNARELARRSAGAKHATADKDNERMIA